MSVQSLSSVRSDSLDFREAREDLAAVFRWTARLNMHEGIANHFSLAVSDDGMKFLVNPYGRHFSKMRARDLILVDAAGDPPEALNDTLDPTAYYIHGAMHRNNPRARCVMHVHSKYATALSTLKDPTIPPIDQTTMRYYNRVAIDDGFDGMGLGEEAERLSRALGNHSVIMMCQHGFMTAASTVAEAFDALYFFERAAETYLLALATGRALNIASHDVAEKTAQQWATYPDTGVKHLRAIRDILDEEEPEYRD